MSKDLVDEATVFCRDLGVGTATYSPLSRTFVGRSVKGDYCASSAMVALLYYITNWSIYLFVMCLTDFSFKVQQEEFGTEWTYLQRLADVAVKHGYTPVQLALAWLLLQGNDIVPIPGVFSWSSAWSCPIWSYLYVRAFVIWYLLLISITTADMSKTVQFPALSWTQHYI